MTPRQIRALTPALDAFLQRFLFCCAYTQTFDLLGIYCRGLLSDLPRKSVEPIALHAGVPIRTLQEFLRDHVWHFDQARALLQRHVADLLPALPADELGTVGLIDETATVKKGAHTPGVQRQWCGERGKKENCLVTVHLGVARGSYKTLLDADLFLPEAWDQDRPRCRTAGIPDDLHYQPKWQLGLRQVDRARDQGVAFDWLTFDEYYGSKPEFLAGLDERRLCYVGEVPKSFACFARKPRAGQKGRRADALVRHSPAFTRQPWRVFRLQRQTLGPQEWEAKAARVWLSSRAGASARQYWLVWARNPRTGEEKYFVSSAPARASLRRLLRVAFTRWNVEHAIRVSKSELGFRHYEGRSYVGLMRHLVLCLLMLTFAAGQTVRLREKKSGADSGTGVPGLAAAEPGVAGGVAGDVGTGAGVGGDWVSPGAEPVGAAVPAAAGVWLGSGEAAGTQKATKESA